MSFLLAAPYQHSDRTQSVLFNPDDPFSDVIGVYFGSDDEVVEEGSADSGHPESRGNVRKAGQRGQQLDSSSTHRYNTRLKTKPKVPPRMGLIQTKQPDKVKQKELELVYLGHHKGNQGTHNEEKQDSGRWMSDMALRPWRKIEYNLEDMEANMEHGGNCVATVDPRDLEWKKA